MNIETAAELAFQIGDKPSLGHMTDPNGGRNDEDTDRQKRDQDSLGVPLKRRDRLIIIKMHGMVRLSTASDLSPPHALGQENMMRPFAKPHVLRNQRTVT